ncbi:S26 family signal peptidase [Phytohabitans rumicis]|uniref:S26 family signal peptidase n=1 Tax=Phytohabitans rumicis TaxID=1076125 RepID=A0A6V8LMF9_9ACTN|nr:S26 family signal peptidase [Phytohabitans rumicis]
MLVVVGLAVALGVRSVRGRYVVVTVEGVSMAPTLVDGDRVVVRRRSATEVRPGDVVVLEPPADASAGTGPGGPVGPRWNIKRVVAVAGDPVPDDVPVEGVDRVPAGSLVVFGDNPDGVDSRQRGLFESARLLGVAVRRLGGRPL